MGGMSWGQRAAAAIGGFLLTCVVVTGLISYFSSPADGVAFSKVGFHIVGNGGGAVKQGIGEVGVGYRETADINTPTPGAAANQNRAQSNRALAACKAANKKLPKAQRVSCTVS